MPVPVPLRATAVPLVVLAALLAGCAQSAVPSEPQQPVTSTPVSSGAILPVATPTAKESGFRAVGWQKVAIDGSVRSITHHSCSPNLLAAGLRDDDQPLLVDVTHGVARAFKGELPNRLHNGLSAVATDGENTFVTEDVDPARAEPATM